MPRFAQLCEVGKQLVKPAGEQRLVRLDDQLNQALEKAEIRVGFDKKLGDAGMVR